MKAKYLFGALALPFALAACSDDVFETNSMKTQEVEGEVIELPEGFALVGSKSEAATRAGAIDKKLGWYPSADAALDAATILAEENWDRIGLAWLNKAGAQDGQVYTNYKFQHYGWLNSGETAAEYDKCENNVLTNGVWFTGETTQANQFKKWNGTAEINVTNFWNSPAYQFDKATFTAAGVDANRGLFSTSNGTIFGGDYIVYYPFNPEMKDICYLQAISPKEIVGAVKNGTTGDYQTPLFPHYFLLGKTQISGGVKSSDFTMGQLSGAVAVQLKNNTNTAINNVTSVVLYAKKGAFYTSVKLDASKISGSDVASKGAELYVAGVENNTTATLISKTADANGINIASKNGNTPGTAVFGFAALPTTIDELLVIVQDKDGNTYVQEISNGLTVKSLATKDDWGKISVDVPGLSNKNLYAYDLESFKTAIAKANSTAIATAPATIHLLGEVVLTEGVTIPNHTTVKAMTATDKLIVARNEGAQIVLRTSATSTLDCDVDIQGQGCCGLTPAKMMMAGTLEVERTITNQGQIQFGNGTNKSQSAIKGNIVNTVDPEDDAQTPSSIVVKAKTKVDLYGELTNEANNSIVVETAGTGHVGEDGTLDILANGILTNNGDMTIKGNVGTDPQNNAQFINNGTITEKVSAQISGLGVTEQAAGAAYICEVNSVERYNAAIYNDPNTAIRPTTLVRFIDQSPVDNQTYTLVANDNNGTITNFKGDIIDFESALDNNYRVTLKGDNSLYNSANPVRPYDAQVKVGDFTVKSGALTIEHDNLTAENFAVNHSQTSNGNIEIKNNTFTVNQNFTMKYMGNHANSDFFVTGKLVVNGNMNIESFASTAGDIQFNAPVIVGGTLTLGVINAAAIKIDNDLSANAMIVTNTTGKYVEVKEGLKNTKIATNLTVATKGLMKFNKNSVTTIGNLFNNDGKVNIVPQTQVGSGDVAALVYCKDFTNYGKEANWENKSYPQVKK